VSVENKVQLKKGEEIITAVRRYGLTLLWQWFIILLLLAVPFFFMFWLFRHDWWGMTLFLAPIIFGLAWIIRIIFLWRKNVLVITNQRLIDYDQRGLFDQLVSEIFYDQVEDVHGRIRGVWGTIFRYGEITIQSGNGKINIIAKQIKQPVYLQQEINELRQNYLAKKTLDFSKGAVEAVIDGLYELELEDLIRVKNVVEKRINKNKDQKITRSEE